MALSPVLFQTWWTGIEGRKVKKTARIHRHSRLESVTPGRKFSGQQKLAGKQQWSANTTRIWYVSAVRGAELIFGYRRCNRAIHTSQFLLNSRTCFPASRQRSSSEIRLALSSSPIQLFLSSARHFLRHWAHFKLSR